MMRMKAFATAVLALGLIGGVVALAQMPELPQPTLTEPAVATETSPPVALDSPPIARAAEPAQDDPMQVVEAFVVRNHKEAEDAIASLTKEAETLRARLHKVEAALERWKAVEDALKQGPPPAHLESIPSAAPGRTPAPAEASEKK